MTDIPTIAKGLSEAQRRLLLGDIESPPHYASYVQVRSALGKKGLRCDSGISPTGLAVRAYLMENGG